MIETVGLTKRYADVVAVDDLSLRVDKGESWGLGKDHDAQDG